MFNIAIMCYHTSHPDERAIRKHFKSLGSSEYEGGRIYHTNAFKKMLLPVTLSTSPTTLSAGRFKFIPDWAIKGGDLGKVYNTENARGEELFGKASFKNYIGTNRGLLYVDGFWEPHRPDESKKDTVNEYCYLPDKEIFTLGIVWREYLGITTFAVITSDPTEQMAKIHNRLDKAGNPDPRMPLVIDPSDREEWLLNNDEAAIKELIRPWPFEFQHHRTVRVTAMTREETNYPSIQDPI